MNWLDLAPLLLMFAAMATGALVKVQPEGTKPVFIAGAGWCAPGTSEFVRQQALVTASRDWPSMLHDSDRDWLIAMVEPALLGREDEVAHSWLKRTKIRG